VAARNISDRPGPEQRQVIVTTSGLVPALLTLARQQALKATRTWDESASSQSITFSKSRLA